MPDADTATGLALLVVAVLWLLKPAPTPRRGVSPGRAPHRTRPSVPPLGEDTTHRKGDPA